MTDDFEQETGSGLALVLKILVVTGIVGLLAGAFLLAFVNVTIGLVIALVGMSDLAVVYVLSRTAGGQGEQ